MAEKWILDILGPSPFDLKLSDCPSHIWCAFKGERLRGCGSFLPATCGASDISYLSNYSAHEGDLWHGRFLGLNNLQHGGFFSPHGQLSLSETWLVITITYPHELTIRLSITCGHSLKKSRVWWQFDIQGRYSIDFSKWDRHDR